MNQKRAIISVSVACVTSALAWAVNGAWFLTLPGGLLMMILLGRIASQTRPGLRVILNVVATSALLYMGGALWTWGNDASKQPATRATRAVFIFWLVLLIPWLVVGPLSGMAFDGGATPEAYAFFWSTITYPVSVG